MDETTLIGIDVGGSFTKGGLVTAGGRVLHRAAPQPTGDGPNAVATARRMVAGLLQEAQARGLPPVAAVGLSTCGLTDPARGRVIQSTSVPDYDGTDWFALLGDFGLPLAVENDARAAAWAEYTARERPELRHWVHVPIGTSLGAGIILNGALWPGSTFSAGELGHITVEAGGPRCACGNRGCLENYVSAQGLLDFVRGALETGCDSSLRALEPGALDLPAVLDAGRRGDLLAQQAFERVGRYLGAGLTTVVNLINPQVITLGGGIVEAAGTVAEAAREYVAEHALAAARLDLQILPGRLGNRAGFVGAALLALRAAEQRVR